MMMAGTVTTFDLNVIYMDCTRLMLARRSGLCRRQRCRSGAQREQQREPQAHPFIRICHLQSIVPAPTVSTYDMPCSVKLHTGVIDP